MKMKEKEEILNELNAIQAEINRAWATMHMVEFAAKKIKEPLDKANKKLDRTRTLIAKLTPDKEQE